MKSESAVLRRLGPVPFWRGERKCLDVLGEIYSRAMDSARERIGRVPSSGGSVDMVAKSAKRGGKHGTVQS